MWPAIIGAATSIGGGLLSGLMGDDDSPDTSYLQAGQQQQNYWGHQGRFDLEYAKANAARRMNEAQTVVAPWLNVGNNALSQYAGLIGVPGYSYVDPTGYLQATPGYQWRFKEGMRALDQSAASKGMLLSGQQVKRSQEYGQNYATEIYNSLLDRLANLSTQGYNAAQYTGSTGMQEAGLNANLSMGQANAAMGMAGGMSNALMNQYQAAASNPGTDWGGLIGLGSAMLGNALTQYPSRQSTYTLPSQLAGYIR